MADILMDHKYRNRFPDTKISFLIVSKVELLNKKPIFNILREKAPELAEALQNWRIIPGLFK